MLVVYRCAKCGFEHAYEAGVKGRKCPECQSVLVETREVVGGGEGADNNAPVPGQYSAVNYGETNGVAAVLKLIGIGLIGIGVIVFAVLVGEIAAAAAAVLISCGVSGIMFLGFSEIIRLLQELVNKE